MVEEPVAPVGKAPGTLDAFRRHSSSSHDLVEPGEVFLDVGQSMIGLRQQIKQGVEAGAKCSPILGLRKDPQLQ